MKFLFSKTKEAKLTNNTQLFSFLQDGKILGSGFWRGRTIITEDRKTQDSSNLEEDEHGEQCDPQKQKEWPSSINE